MGSMIPRVKNPKLDGTNPHFRSKFSTLGEVYRVVYNALPADHFITQTVTDDGEGAGPFLVTALNNKDGIVAQSAIPFVVSKQDPQGLGSALTYHRRYGLCTLFGIVGDDDDDGNAATPPAASKSSSSSSSSTGEKKSGLKKGKL